MENSEKIIATETDAEKNASGNTTKKNTLFLDKIINWCFYILVALFPLWFLPLTSDVLNLNKQLLLAILTTIAFVAWLGKLLTQDNIKWYKGLLVILFLVFFAIYGLSTALSIRPYDSLMGFDTHLSRSFINLIYFFALFVLFVNYKETKKEKYSEIFKLLIIFLVSSALVVIIGLLHIFKAYILPWEFTKAISFNTIGSLTSLGMYAVILIPTILGLFFAFRSDNYKMDQKTALGLKIFLSAVLILSLFLTVILNFLSLWIMLAVTMILLVGFGLGRRHSLVNFNTGKIVLPMIILAICLVFILFKPNLTPGLNLPLEVGLTYKGGTNIVVETIKDKPILGTGPETFVYNYSLYKPQGINQSIFWNVRFTNAPIHVLNILSETGILGILSLLALLIVFVLKVIKNIISNEDGISQLTEIKIGLFSAWIALLLAWFLYPQNITLMFVFWLLFIFLTVLCTRKKDVITINLKTSSKIALLLSFSFIVVMIAVVGLLYLEGSKYLAEAKYKSSMEKAQEGDLEDAINGVVNATVINSHEDKFYRNLAQLFLFYSNQSLNDNDLTEEERAQRVQLGISNAINSAVRATVLDSQDVSNWIIRGYVYRNLINTIDGAGDWAIKSYQQALTLEPTNPFIYTEIARTFMAATNLAINAKSQEQAATYLNSAINAYNNAIQLKSDYSPANFEVALAYDIQGKVDEAIAKLEAIKGSNLQDAGLAFQLGVLYYKDSQFGKAKTEFTRAISIDNNYSNALYFLGLLYDREGNKEVAIEQFEKVAELNPENELVQQILVNLRAGKPALGSPELGPPEQPEEIPIEEGSIEPSKFQLP